MDYGTPYLIAAYVFGAAVLLSFVAVMIATSWRYVWRMGWLPRGTDLTPSDLTPEELGMLAGGNKRLVEVVLFRLCLEGKVGLLHDTVVALSERARPGEGGGGPVSEVLLDRLHKAQPRASQQAGQRHRHFGRRRTVQRPVHLTDLLYYGTKQGDGEPTRRRLVELRMVDETAARVCRLRDRAFSVYVWMATAAVVVLVAAAIPGQDGTLSPSHLWYLVAVGLLFLVIAPSIARITGGQLFPTTPAGQMLLYEAAREPVDADSDSLLRYVALQGIRAHPDFERAAHSHELDHGVSTELKTFNVATEVLNAIAPFFGGGGGPGARGGPR